MAILRGPHLHTPLTLLTSDRDALSRVDPAMVAPGDDARYLVTRAGAAALREDEDGLLRPALETADPRGSTHQPLVLLAGVRACASSRWRSPSPAPSSMTPAAICAICVTWPMPSTPPMPT